MEQAHFEGIVRRFSVVAEAAPARYRLRVGAFAVLGYVVYLGILLAALGLVIAMAALAVFHPSIWMIKVGWKLGIPLLIFVVAMLRALKVSVPPPSGLAVSADQAPALFELVDRVRTELAVPELERVLLTDAYNASVVQLPRLGLFGSLNYLMLGVPLLQALSKEDVAAVLGHEFGHLSHNHSRFAGFVYRSVRSYAQVLEATGDNRILEKFLNWYVPRLDALSFPLRRMNEYEADAASAQIVGKERAGQALTNVHVRAAIEPEFWSAVERQVLQSPHPPAQLYLDWERRVNGVAAPDAEKALEQALAEPTGTADTHPSLRDRLAKLGVEPQLERAAPSSAARALLGERYAYFVEQAGYLWSSRVHESWRMEHQRLIDAKARAAALDRERNSRPLTNDEAFEYACAVEDAEPDRDALPLYQAVLSADEPHVGARFAVGRLLLARDDPAGVAIMKQLQSAADLDVRRAAGALLAEYYTRHGDEKGVEVSLSRARDAAVIAQAHERERGQLTIADTFASHALSSEALARLREDLSLFPGVKRAYLVRKVVNGELAFFVIALDVRLKLRVIDDESLSRRVLDTVSLPGPTWCIRLDRNGRFAKPLKAVDGSLVYPA